MNQHTKEKLLNHLSEWQKIRSESDKELLNSANDLLSMISKMQKSLEPKCIADVDTPCDCPKCEAYALEMKKEYEAGNLDPVEDDEECPHSEHDHFICMDCGKDCINDFIGEAESAFEGDR